MNQITPIHPTLGYMSEQRRLREHFADQLFDRVMDTQRNAPTAPTLQSPAYIANLLHVWNGVGGFLLTQPNKDDAKQLAELRVEFRSFKNPALATRARRVPYSKLLANDEPARPDFVSPLFLNAAHYPDQRQLAALRHTIYQDATTVLNADLLFDALADARDEVTQATPKLSPQQRTAMFLYREVDGNYTVGINNALTLREELFHTFQTILNVSRSYMSHEMQSDAQTSPFIASVLSRSKSEQIDNRNTGKETAYQRMERRLGYLLSDRELQARIDKVCVEIGRVPEAMEDPAEFLQGLGLALGGLKDLEGHGGSIWERSIIGGKPSRAMAELNFAIVAAFPDGVSQHFREVALPYHMAQVVRVNSFDAKYEMARRYGFQRSKAYRTGRDGTSKLLRGLTKATAG